MNHRLFHQSSHRQNLFQKFEVAGSIGQSSFQRVLNDTTICWQKEGSRVILNDDQALMKTKCSIMQMLSCKIK